MLTAILLIRHGETEWNRGGIFRGTHDVPLNDNGREQARALATALAARPIDAGFTSPLSRATETARIVLAPHGSEAVVEQAFLDFDYGEWTGIEDAEVARRWPDDYERWTRTPHLAHPPGGDTLARVLERAFAALERIVRSHDGETVALFAHRVVNKLLVLGMLGLPLDRFNFIRQDNCCVNEFERTDAGYVAVTLNDTSHLRQAGTDVLRADF